MTTRPSPKPWIDAIHAYVPGKATGASGKPLVKLSANENPLGCSPQALQARAKAGHPALYPDPDSTQLREAIGKLHGIDPALIVCGSGSGELLEAAVQGYCGPGDAILFSEYSFSLYPLLAARCGAETIASPARDYAADVDAMLASLTPNTRVVLLDNPNNPTGTCLPHTEVRRLHAAMPADVLLVIDQAYAEYVDPKEAAKDFDLAMSADNVLVTRTFSKGYGLAGERIGWAMGAPHLVDILNRLRGPFNVSLCGQAAAEAALADQAFVTQSREHNERELAKLKLAIAALGNHGLRMLPSKANFALLLFEGALSAEAAKEAIADAGYAVRHLPGQGLPHALRITIGTAEDMQAVADALRHAAEAA